MASPPAGAARLSVAFFLGVQVARHSATLRRALTPGRVLEENVPNSAGVLIVAIPLNETHQTLTRLLTIEAVVNRSAFFTSAKAPTWME